MAQPTAISRYQIRDRLGHGGMGVLYLALDPAIDRLVAVKLLRVNNPDIRERFIREAQIAARLQHPHIVTVFDVGTHEGQPFIAMEYIAGETMGELIHRRAPLSLSRKLELVADICEGLAYAHKRGVVHRDVKPANLMVGRESGTVKILDFGIARTAGSNLTQVGMVMGTPNYMSPEQIAGQTVDHRSDIFAVGAVLYEVLVHRQAFTGDTPHAVLHQITSVEPPRVSAINADLDPELDEILARAMAKAPANRYADLTMMRNDLLRVRQRLEAQQEGHTIIGEIGEPIARLTPTPTPRSARAGPDRARIAERRAARIASHLQSAEAALAAGSLDDALVQVELGAEIEPDDPRIVRLHERIRREIDARDAARLLGEARASLVSGALTEAGRLLAEAGQLAVGSPEVQTLGREIDRAFEQRERLREQTRKAREALDLAREYLSAGAFDAALRASSEALGYRPDDREALEIRQSIRDAIERRNQVVMRDARAQAADGRYDSAIRLLQAIRPADEAIDTLLSEVETARDEVARERAAREQAAREQAAREAAERERLRREDEAREQARQQQIERERRDRERTEQQRLEATRAFETFVTSHAEALDAALDEGRWADARSYLGVLEDRAPDTPGLDVRRARIVAGIEAERRHAAIERLLADARARLHLEDWDEADRVVSDALALDPSSLDAIELRHAIANAREAAARRAREEARQIEARRAEEERARREAERQAALRAELEQQRERELAARLARRHTPLPAPDIDRTIEGTDSTVDEPPSRGGDSEDTLETDAPAAFSARAEKRRRPTGRTPIPAPPSKPANPSGTVPPQAAPLEFLSRPVTTPSSATAPRDGTVAVTTAPGGWLSSAQAKAVIAATVVLAIVLGGWLVSRRRVSPVDPKPPVQSDQRPPVQSPGQPPTSTTSPAATPPVATPPVTVAEPPVAPPTTLPNTQAAQAAAEIEVAARRAQQAGDLDEALRQALLGLKLEPTSQRFASIARALVSRAAGEAAGAQRRADAVAGSAEVEAYRTAARESQRSSLLPLVRAAEAVIGYRRAVQLFDQAATERQAALAAEETRTRQAERQAEDERRRRATDEVRTQTQDAQRLMREQKWTEALDVLKKVRALDAAAPGLDALVKQAENGLLAQRQAQTRPGTTAPDPAEAARAGITQLLETFKRGYESRDLGAIRRIWPGMPKGFSDSYDRLFRDNRALSWDYQMQSLSLASDGKSARVQCRVEVGQQGDRRTATEQRTYIFDLTSSGAAWSIGNVTVPR